MYLSTTYFDCCGLPWISLISVSRPASYQHKSNTWLPLVQADGEKQQALMTLAVRVSTLVAAFDSVAADADAMADAATQFQDILQVRVQLIPWLMQCVAPPAHCRFRVPT